MYLENGRRAARHISHLFEGQFDPNYIIIVGSALIQDQPKDIDVIVEGPYFDVHQLRMPPTFTAFGGARFAPVDIWHLEDSWCFRRNPGMEPTLDNYLRWITKGKKIAYRAMTDMVVEYT